MDNREMIKTFINKLTLKYQNNKIVSNLIEQLSTINEFDSVTNDNNITRCVYDNGNKEVLFDEMNKSIIFREKNKVLYDNKIVTVIYENTYIEEDYGFHINTKKVTEENKTFKTGDVVYVTDDLTVEKSSLINGVKIIEDEKIKVTDRYKNDEHVFNSVSNNYNKYQKQGDRLLLLDGNSGEKNLYLLANGDALKIVNNNGVEEYYYCDANEMHSNDEESDNKASFNVKINYVDFLKILENTDNAIDIEQKSKIR